MMKRENKLFMATIIQFATILVSIFLFLKNSWFNRAFYRHNFLDQIFTPCTKVPGENSLCMNLRHTKNS